MSNVRRKQLQCAVLHNIFIEMNDDAHEVSGDDIRQLEEEVWGVEGVYEYDGIMSIHIVEEHVSISVELQAMHMKSQE